jgi:hypothetical protein
MKMLQKTKERTPETLGFLLMLSVVTSMAKANG